MFGFCGVVVFCVHWADNVGPAATASTSSTLPGQHDLLKQGQTKPGKGQAYVNNENDDSSSSGTSTSFSGSYASTDDASTDDASTDDASTDDTSTDNASTDDSKTGNASTDNASTDNYVVVPSRPVGHSRRQRRQQAVPGLHEQVARGLQNKTDSVMEASHSENGTESTTVKIGNIEGGGGAEESVPSPKSPILEVALKVHLQARAGLMHCTGLRFCCFFVYLCF